MAKLRVLQSAALEGTLLNRAEVKAAWSAAFSRLRDRALGMSDRIALSGANRSAADLRKIVDAEIRSLLEAVSTGDF